MKQSLVKRLTTHARPITSRALRLIPGVGVDYYDIRGLASCASPEGIFNTGVPTCDIKKKKIKGIIFTDPGVRFSGSEIQSVGSFINAVKTKTTAARGGRVYPIWDLQNFTDNTGDPATGAVGNLTTATIVTNDAVPAFSLGYNGTEARHRKMSAMNAMSLAVLFVDSAYTVYGYDDGAGGIKGYDVLQAYTDVSKFPVDNAVDQYRFRLTLGDINQYRDQSQFVVTNSGILSAVGLINVTLTQFSLASNVVKLIAIAEGGANMQVLNGTAIAGLTWTAINLQTGAAVSITTVAEDGTNDAFTLTIDSTAWSALGSGESIQIFGPTPAALSAAGVKPYEFISIIVTKP